MGRTARSISSDAEVVLAAAIRLEYNELMVRSARQTVASPATQKKIRALRKQRDARVTRYDAVFRALPSRPAHAPSQYPHFIEAARRLYEAGESLTTLVRYGLKFLPGLDDSIAARQQALLIDQIKKTIARRKKS